MNILSVIEALSLGGAEVALTDLIVGLSEHRHVVWHLSGENRKSVHRAHVRRLTGVGVPVRHARPRDLVDPGLRRHLLDGFRPDVVMFHWWRSETWAPWIVEALRTPHRPHLVCVLHSTRPNLGPGYDRYVVVADFQRRRLPDPADACVRLIPNAVDLQRYQAPSRAERSTSQDPLVIGSLAGLRPEKVPETMIADAIAWRVRRARWRLAGDGPYRAPFETEARRHGAPGQFTFVGHLPRRSVPRFLSDLDVLCHRAHPEALESNPIAVIEALAAGVPVVSEALGGMAEVIEHGSNGLLAAEPDEMGEMLRSLDTDRSLLRRLSAAARRSAHRFGRPAQLAAYRNLLMSLGAGRANHEPSVAPASEARL